VPEADDAGVGRAAAPGTPAAHPLAAPFYRAVVSHADVWRQRMDATTNWAAATTAGMVTFVFNDPRAPHVVLLLAAAFAFVFLLMESRRYQIYDLWRQRFRRLNRFLIAPVLAGESADGDDVVREQMAALAVDLGRTIPTLPLADAVGYRIRRNYGYVFAIITLAWLLKLDLHPTSATSVDDFVLRAGIGLVPGDLVMALVGAFLGGCVVLAVRAPGEHMLNWAETPAPLSRLMSESRRLVPGVRGRRPGDERA
jgi:uncharacterized membrane protein